MVDFSEFTNLEAGDLVTSGASSLVLTFTAGAAISKGDPVYLTGDGEVSPATSDQPCIGVALNNASAGEEVSVCVFGIVKVVAGEAISAGAKVKGADSSKRVLALVVGTDSETLVLGTALTSASAAGDEIFVLVGR